MSKGTSPSHHFTSNYDGYYDPDFTAEISTKMQVPDRISLAPDSGLDSAGFLKAKNMHNEYERLQMHVPDRILLAGGENHLEDQISVPELNLESKLQGSAGYPGIQLVNPPHCLTLDNHHYPAIEEEENRGARIRVRTSDPFSNTTTSSSSTGPMLRFQNGYSVSPPTPPGNQPEDDLTLLRRQVRSLTRRVLAIEQDNQQLHQREIVFCTGVVFYFVIKGLFWLNRNW